MTSPDPDPRPNAVRDVQYKGAPLDAEKGPGLGCFYSQLTVLVGLIVLTPLAVAANWPFPITAVLLFAILILLFVSGQTMIFLLRLVAADRRADARRRPLASRTPTVGEIEDAGAPDGAGSPPTEAPPERGQAIAPEAAPDSTAQSSGDGVRE